MTTTPPLPPTMRLNINNRYTNKIDETFVEIDTQLEELDKGSIYSLPHRIAQIRNNFYRLFNYFKDFDIDNFANHKSGEKTPVDCFWRQSGEKKK